MSFEQSEARQGLDRLLQVYPHLDLVSAEWRSVHWLEVTLGQRGDLPGVDGRPVFALWPFAIWSTTGAVHGVGHDGAVTDDPILP